MSDSESRAARRQQGRSGGSTPPKGNRMMPVYIAIGVVVVLIVGGLAYFRWTQQKAIDAAYATPSPVPTTSGGPAPIQLIDGTAIGKIMIPVGKQSADTAKGGTGQTIDGIPCAGMEYATLHIHPHLAIFDNGVQVQVPRMIGAAPTAQGGCLYWVHNHDASGLIHIEAPVLAPPGASGFTLGIFFDIWGQPLTRDNVAGIRGPVTAYVNGVKYDGDPRLIPLTAHAQITLEVGKVVPPPVYAFPPNE